MYGPLQILYGINKYSNLYNNLFLILNEVYVGMGYDFYNAIQGYGNGNILTIEYIVKTIQNISGKRTDAINFINNHTRNN